MLKRRCKICLFCNNNLEQFFLRIIKFFFEKLFNKIQCQTVANNKTCLLDFFDKSWNVLAKQDQLNDRILSRSLNFWSTNKKFLSRQIIEWKVCKVEWIVQTSTVGKCWHFQHTKLSTTAAVASILFDDHGEGGECQ